MADPTRYKVKQPKSEVEMFMSTFKVPNKDFAEFCVKLFHDKTLPPYLGALRDHCKDQYETNMQLKQASNMLKVGYALAVGRNISLLRECSTKVKKINEMRRGLEERKKLDIETC
jgi:hypothetical protein